MSFTRDGYTPQSIDQILSRVLYRFKEIRPDISLDPSSIFYQWAQVVAQEIYYQQLLVERIVANITLAGSSGVFLDRHLINRGLHRKKGEFAEGYIQIKKNDVIKEILIKKGTKVVSSEGKSYSTDKDVYYKTSYPIKRGLNYTDGVGNNIYELNGISGVYKENSLTTPYTESGASTSGWWYESGEIHWTDKDIVTNDYYYIVPSGYITLEVPIIADEYGEDGNTAAETITTIYNNNIDEVTNISGIANGSDTESDSAARLRGYEANGTQKSPEYIQGQINQIDGVKHARVYNAKGTDKTIVSDWNTTSGLSGGINLTDTGETYGFSFYPSGYVGTLNGFTVKGLIQGTPGKLDVYLKLHQSGQYDTGEDGRLASTYIDRGDIDDITGYTQDIYFPLKYNNLDRTETYRVYIKPNNADSNNYFRIITTGNTPTGNYRDSSFTGSYNLGETGYIYKTHFNAPGLNVSVYPQQGYSFEDLKDIINDKLDDGLVPIGVQAIIEETLEKKVKISVDLMVLNEYDFDEVRLAVISNIDEYLESLIPGDNVIYSQIERIILTTPGVLKDKQLLIGFEDESYIDREVDLLIGRNEYAIIGSTNIREY